MDPGVSDLQALLAAVRRPRSHVADLIQMRTGNTHPASSIRVIDVLAVPIGRQDRRGQDSQREVSTVAVQSA